MVLHWGIFSHSGSNPVPQCLLLADAVLSTIIETTPPFLEKLFPLSAVLPHLCVSCKSYLLLLTLLALPQHVGCCPPLLHRSYITSLPDPLLLIHLLQQHKLTVCNYSKFNFHTGGTVVMFSLLCLCSRMSFLFLRMNSSQPLKIMFNTHLDEGANT